MIEIILDGNLNDEFCGKKYLPVEINEFTSGDWSEYKNTAKRIIAEHIEKEAVIIKINNEKFSLNKLALALFAESFEKSGNLEYAVFKVDDLYSAREQYKPYVALTIGIKYALNLANEAPKTVFKNISELGYLGIKSKRDYYTNTLTLSLPNSDEKARIIETDNLQDTICAVGLMKSLSLAEVNVNFELKIKCIEANASIDKDEMIQKIIADISPWIN